MEFFDVPERMECASAEWWLPDTFDDKTESGTETPDSWYPRLERCCRGDRKSSPVCSETLVVLLLDRRFLSGFSLAFSAVFTRSLCRFLLLAMLPATAPAAAPAPAAAARAPPLEGLDERLRSVLGPEPSRKLSAGMAEISEALTVW